MLPPEQLPGGPAAVLAHRTSPTNLGLYLLSAVAPALWLAARWVEDWRRWIE